MEIYSMLVYNTIFFAECQDGNGFLFHFINFAQTQVIFYSKLTSKNIPFLLSMCSCFQSGSLRRKLCSISQLITFTKNGQELLPYIQKSRRGHLSNGKFLGVLQYNVPYCNAQITATVSAHRSAYSNQAVWRYARSYRCSLPAARPRQRHLPSWQ